MHAGLQALRGIPRETGEIAPEIQVIAEKSFGATDLLSTEARKTSCDRLYDWIPPTLKNSDLAYRLV